MPDHVVTVNMTGLPEFVALVGRVRLLEQALRECRAIAQEEPDEYVAINVLGIIERVGVHEPEPEPKPFDHTAMGPELCPGCGAVELAPGDAACRACFDQLQRELEGG